MSVCKVKVNIKLTQVLYDGLINIFEDFEDFLVINDIKCLLFKVLPVYFINIIFLVAIYDSF